MAAEAAHEARVAELEGQLASATRYADGQGQHIGQLEAQLGEAQRRQQSLQGVRFCTCAMYASKPCCVRPAQMLAFSAQSLPVCAKEEPSTVS